MKNDTLTMSEAMQLVEDRQIIVYRVGKDGENQWVAEVLSLPGCIATAEGKEDAVVGIYSAMDAWYEAAQQRDRLIPTDSLDAELRVISSPERRWVQK